MSVFNPVLELGDENDLTPRQFETMKAISLWQPWASLYVWGEKTFETRHWPTKHRGWLLVHAAGTWNKDIRAIVHEPHFRTVIAGRELPLKALIGAVYITDCLPTDDPSVTEQLKLKEFDRYFGDYAPGRFAWKAINPVVFQKPIPFCGKQGFFNVPGWVVRDVLPKPWEASDVSQS
jgi:hypothetical protein